MFKKDRDMMERSRCLMKNKEIKKIRSDILSQMSRLEENDVTEMIPNKCQLEAVKLASKTVLYYVDGVPLLFDEFGRNNLTPTIYFLWKYPNALTSLTIHSPVSEFILKGADLMLPGLAHTNGKPFTATSYIMSTYIIAMIRTFWAPY